MSIFFSVRFGLLNSCLVSLLDTFICELYNLVTCLAPDSAVCGDTSVFRMEN